MVKKTTSKEILDKLGTGISIEDAVIEGTAVNESHNYSGAQNTSSTIYTVPASKKLIVFLVYSVVKDSITSHANLVCKNSDDEELYIVDKSFALNTNFHDGVVFALEAGAYFVHQYNTGDGAGKSTFSILGILIDA